MAFASDGLTTGPQYLDKFPLILLFERLDESLVLMRRIFNWDLFDVSYLKLLDSSTAAGS